MDEETFGYETQRIRKIQNAPTYESNSERYFIPRKCLSCQERNKIRNNVINQDAFLTKIR